MTIIENPWIVMSNGSQRRASMIHDIYWIREEIEGKYGLKISLNFLLEDGDLDISSIKLKNIEVFENKTSKKTHLYLLLKDQSAYELFYQLCNDLIIKAETTKNEQGIIKILINRLNRWKNLLVNNYDKSVPLETQMGLFSELDTLLNYVSSKLPIEEAVCSWGGPDADRQDFILENLALEVKSHRSGKSECVTISNLHQLYSTKENFILRVYSLDKNENGITIEDLIQEIKKLLLINEAYKEIDLLEQKINQYGYFDSIHQKYLTTFKVDKVSIYNVTKEFPKLIVDDIPGEIINLKYQIDLAKCKNFLLDEELSKGMM